MNKKLFILTLIILLGAFLRFYNLDTIPAGAYIDEASHGYNAYSLLLTGKDEWGKTFPVFLREFGNYPSPLYTYLSIIPIKLMGLSVFSVRFVSALSGTLLILLTFLIVNQVKKNTENLAFIAALLIAISPWAILFSRAAIEANLALTLVTLSFYLLLVSVKIPYFFTAAAIVMGLTSHAYHAERIVGFIFLTAFLFIYRERFAKNKMWVLLGIILFSIIQIPQFLLLNQPGALKRFDQLNYFSYDFYLTNSKQFQGFLFGQQIYAIREFFSQYFAYLSPRNLFFDPDPQLIRSIPNLSVFYTWMFLPFILVFKGFQKIKNNRELKMLVVIIFVSPIPAALVRDPFYTLRTLPLFWGLTIVIAIGVNKIMVALNRGLKPFVIFLVLLLSLLPLYSSNFILLKHERSDIYGYPYQKFAELSKNFPNTQFVLDSQESFPTYIWIAFYKKFDPTKMQEISSPRINNDYYGNVPFDGRYVLDNIDIRPIYWSDDVYKDQILVGTTLAISEKQANEHKLSQVFQIQDLSGKVYLVGYQTHPQQKCMQGAKLIQLDWHCKGLIK